MQVLNLFSLCIIYKPIKHFGVEFLKRVCYTVAVLLNQFGAETNDEESYNIYF